MGHLLFVNVGRPRLIGTHQGEPVLSAYVKRPVGGRVRAHGVNLDGDEQADLNVHGGPDKAIYAYASEDLGWWSEQLGREAVPGTAFGENLTTAGIDCTGAVIGERWTIGEVELEVCQPRLPCFKLGLVNADPRLVKRFAQASRPGAYLRIVREGEIGAGDRVEVTGRPAHGVTTRLVSDAVLRDHTLMPAALQAPELAVGLRTFMAERV